MQAAQIIPFHFDTHQVRTVLVDDQPWFVAADVAIALRYLSAKDMTRNLDDDEKDGQIVPTPGGDQEMTVISESGLYSAILRSRKAESKRFKKWVTAEVLPAIRTHGRYEDSNNRMATLAGQTIGTNGFNCLAAVLDGKVRSITGGAKRAVKNHVWQQVHRAFSVVRAEDIPAEQLDAVRNFIASYNVHEGEWIAKESPVESARLKIHYPIECLADRRPGMLSPRNPGKHYLDITLEDLKHNFKSPCELVLSELARAGYNVEAAWWEVRTYRNKLEQLLSMISMLQKESVSPQRYVI
jgi:hypothetical protein